jgi:hypothetical protein
MWGKSIAFTGVLNSRRHPRRRITRKMVFNCTMKHSVNVINTCRTLNNQLTPASTFQNIVINKYGRFNIEFDTKLRQLLSLKWKCDWIEMGICLFASALSTGGFFRFFVLPFHRLSTLCFSISLCVCREALRTTENVGRTKISAYLSQS